MREEGDDGRRGEPLLRPLICHDLATRRPREAGQRGTRQDRTGRSETARQRERRVGACKRSGEEEEEMQMEKRRAPPRQQEAASGDGRVAEKQRERQREATSGASVSVRVCVLVCEMEGRKGKEGCALSADQGGCLSLSRSSLSLSLSLASQSPAPPPLLSLPPPPLLLRCLLAARCLDSWCGCVCVWISSRYLSPVLLHRHLVPLLLDVLPLDVGSLVFL